MNKLFSDIFREAFKDTQSFSGLGRRFIVRGILLLLLSVVLYSISIGVVYLVRLV